MSEIIISTGGIKENYKVLDVIFAASQKKFGGKGIFKRGLEFMTDGDYNELLNEVYVSSTELIKTKAKKIGANAIINCKFDLEQLTVTEQGMMSKGEALRIQVFVTGTAVQFL